MQAQTAPAAPELHEPSPEEVYVTAGTFTDGVSLRVYFPCATTRYTVIPGAGCDMQFGAGPGKPPTNVEPTTQTEATSARTIV
jgi:hypothetical protein